MINHFCNIVYELWMEEAVLRGRILAPGFMTDPLLRKAYLGNLWIGVAPGQIDPTKETAAAQARVDGNFSTVAIESAAMGFDFDQNIKQRKIIVICDRYKAYISLARQLPFITLAFCWAHVRRDFLDATRKYPELETWSLDWVEKIGKLYYINNKRCKEFDPKLPAQWKSALFQQEHDKLIEKMATMAKERDVFINSYKASEADLLTTVKYKVLTSLQNHWQGLSVFVDHPEVPMDNNNGERSIRNPVTGRKNFYGSGSLWSSQLAAMMFSIFQTMILGGLNCRHWLRSYLNACADNHSQPPEDLSLFLPWKMNDSRKQQLSKPFYT